MKSNTKDLRKTVKAILDEHITSYHLRSNKPDVFPYATFEIRELDTTDGLSKCTLEINIMSKDVSFADNTADSIQDAFDHTSYESDAVSFYCYRGQRQHVIEDDKTTYRIRLLIELNVYSTEE